MLAVGISVDSLLEDRGRLEHHDSARRDRYLLAGLGISPDPLPLFAYHKGAEGGQLHGLSPFQAIGDFLQHQLNERSRFGARQPYLLVDRLTQIGTSDCFQRHRQPRIWRSPYPSELSNDMSLGPQGQRPREEDFGRS